MAPPSLVGATRKRTRLSAFAARSTSRPGQSGMDDGGADHPGVDGRPPSMGQQQAPPVDSQQPPSQQSSFFLMSSPPSVQVVQGSRVWPIGRSPSSRRRQVATRLCRRRARAARWPADHQPSPQGAARRRGRDQRAPGHEHRLLAVARVQSSMVRHRCQPCRPRPGRLTVPASIDRGVSRPRPDARRQPRARR